jgi:cellulose synthase/poly-beta-1,6-N-acetylglucosamine synthase-like glycosyltransferase
MSSDVTVLIPARGSCDYIGETLDSIISSYIQPDEVLIIDDGISNIGREFISLYMNRLPIKIQKNSGKGLVDALNTGLNSIKTKYVCRIDSDDLMHEHRIGSQLDRLKSNSNLVAVGSQCFYINGESEIIGTSNYFVGTVNLIPQFKTSCVLAHPSTMFLREPAIKIGGYRSLFTWDNTDIAEDFDFWLRLSSTGLLEVMSENLTFYRQHESQLSSRFQFAQRIGTPYIAAINSPSNAISTKVDFVGGYSPQMSTFLQIVLRNQGVLALAKIILLIFRYRTKN